MSEEMQTPPPIKIEDDLTILSSGESDIEVDYIVHLSELEDFHSETEDEWSEPSNKYNWQRTAGWTPKINKYNENFHCGLTNPTVDENSSPLDVFQLFFTPDLIEYITVQTDRLYRKLLDLEHKSVKSYTHIYKPITTDEIMYYIGETLLMPKIKKIKLNDYWSRNQLLYTPVFCNGLNRDRYYCITASLSFSDDDDDVNFDRLYKIKIVSDALRESFAGNFSPYETICIEESQLITKNAFLFDHNISQKSNFNLRMHAIKDVRTGYVLNFIIDTGVLGGDSEIGGRGEIVLKLIEDYKYKGHKLFLGDSYSSPELFLQLYNLKINACGVVNWCKSNMPKMEENLSRGEIAFQSSGPILAIKWKKKKDVYMLTTMHEPKLMKTENIPISYADYKKSTTVRNKSRADLSCLSVVRKTVKWHQKLFFHLLDISVGNAHVLYNEVTCQEISFMDFHFRLIKDIFQRHSIASNKSLVGKVHHDGMFRLMARHFPSKINTIKGQFPPLRRCVVCTRNKKRQRTMYYCDKCEAPLCVVPCFEIYHTKESLVNKSINK